MITSYIYIYIYVCLLGVFVFISFFKQCPHPDDKQRKELSRDLGLEPLQVKFWFQNKRTQMKVSKRETLNNIYLYIGCIYIFMNLCSIVNLFFL